MGEMILITVLAEGNSARSKLTAKRVPYFSWPLRDVLRSARKSPLVVESISKLELKVTNSKVFHLVPKSTFIA